MDYSVGIGSNEGRAWSSSMGGSKSCKCRGGEMTALPSRVPGYTTKLTMPKVATIPDLG